MCLDAVLLSKSSQYPNLLEVADSIAGQLLGNKECPFSGVTNSGRVWRKVSESGARESPGTSAALHFTNCWEGCMRLPSASSPVLGMGIVSQKIIETELKSRMNLRLLAPWWTPL